MATRSLLNSPSPVLTGLVLLSGVSLAACRDAVDQRAEEPALAVATTITWDSKSQMKQIASTRGCDSWTPTWAPDGNLYTAYGDCRPKGAPQKLGMGFGRLSGVAEPQRNIPVAATAALAGGGDSGAVGGSVVWQPAASTTRGSAMRDRVDGGLQTRCVMATSSWLR